MSILLESLNQQEQPEASSNLPNLQSSHFDDDMLNDDDVYRQLKWWKVAAISSMLLLGGSWLTWLVFDKPQAARSDMQLISLQNQTKQAVSKKLLSPIESEPTESALSEKNQPLTEQAKTNVDSSQSDVITSVYKPQKRSNTLTYQKPGQQASSNKSVGNKAAIFPSQLSAELKDKFPEMAINSYVIADKVEDSFVILDGSIYAVNQLISANLTLREINSDGIVVEFYSQRIKLLFE
jgi:hypothetical protein